MTAQAAAPAIAVEKPYLSYEDFLVQYAGVHAEWVNGEVEVMPPVLDRHDRLSQFLNHLLSTFVALHDSGRIKMAPSQTRLGPDLPGREPDLMFISKVRETIIQPGYVDGPPDLAVEIVSPESQSRDYGTKLDEYEKAGVREYWIIDPVREDALFYQLDDEGILRRHSPDANGHYHARILPGFVLDVPLLWRDPLPTILDVADLVRVMGSEGDE